MRCDECNAETSNKELFDKVLCDKCEEKIKIKAKYSHRVEGEY